MAGIVGMCNPLMDIILRVEKNNVAALGAVPGSMNLVDFETMSRISSSAAGAIRSAGGGGANTMRGLAWLGNPVGAAVRPIYLGAIGDDSRGQELETLFRQQGVEPLLARKGLPTGVSVILVTPDRERTMFTYLGACQEFKPADVPYERLGQAGWFHLTGFLWDTPNQEQAARELADFARKHDRRIAFDVADPFVVHRHHCKLLDWIPGRVDLLFANREELKALTGLEGSDEEIVSAAGSLAPRVVMKTGSDGCWINEDSQLRHVPGERVQAVDTTAAGDAFAAGFLFGLMSGRDCHRSARLANRLAARMVTIVGCNYSAIDRAGVLLALD
jgi:sugar/nucleoside kinase (ribokinase family)